jgi:uncharacterized protein (TIGR00369 family)
VPAPAPAYVARIVERMERFPLHARYGFQVDRCEAGQAESRFTVTDEHLNAGGVIHGGVWCTLLDVAAYCAVMSALDEGLTATTVDLHSQLMKAARLGDEVRMTGRVDRLTRRLVFASAEARLGDELLASARMTKAILPLPPDPG